MEAPQVQSWAKCMRRLLIEARDPERWDLGLDEDVIDGWADMTEAWAKEAGSDSDKFRWIGEIPSDRAEFLLHGLLKISTTDFATKAMTRAEIKEHRPFTFHVIEALLEGLSETGHCDMNYLEQVRSTMAMSFGTN